MTNEELVLRSFITGKSKEFLLAHPDFCISPKQAKMLEAAINRMDKGEPLAYIIRNKEFYGMNYFVKQGVLIPRPETELLVDEAIKYIAACEKNVISVLEIGTGSGCIPLSLVNNVSRTLKITSIDISTEALKVARYNRSRLMPNNHSTLTFQRQDIFKYTPKKQYDLIITNPPYIKTAAIQKLEKNVRDYEPWLALDGGEDGLKFYTRIEQIITEKLLPNGLCICEIGADQGKAINKIFPKNKWSLSLLKDFQGQSRIILVRRKPY